MSEYKTVIDKKTGELKKVPIVAELPIIPVKPEFTPQTLSDNDLATLALNKLSIALQAIDPVLWPSMTCKLADTILDRLKGKPGQSLTVDQTMKVITVDCNITFVQPLSESLLIDHADKPQAIE